MANYWMKKQNKEGENFGWNVNQTESIRRSIVSNPLNGSVKVVFHHIEILFHKTKQILRTIRCKFNI